MRRSFLLVLSLVLTAMIAVVIIGCMSIRTEATVDTVSKHKYVSSIEVKRGDSLWSIAEIYAPKYGMSTKQYVKEMKKLNHLESDFIMAGVNVLVVYYE